MTDEPLTITHDNQLWRLYIVDFRHDGKTYSFRIYATDEQDANRRLRSIKGNAEIIGELGGEIAVNDSTARLVGIWVKALCWWRNLWT